MCFDLLSFLSFPKTSKNPHFHFVLPIFLVFIPMPLIMLSLGLVSSLSSNFIYTCLFLLFNLFSEFSHFTFYLLLLPCDLFHKFLHFCFVLFLESLKSFLQLYKKLYGSVGSQFASALQQHFPNECPLSFVKF